MIKMIQRCRICGNKTLVPLLSLGEQALAGVFPRDREEPVAHAPLELVKCFSDKSNESCGLVQLRHSYNPTKLYGNNYSYRSGLNNAMINHLHQKVRRIAQFFSLASGELVVDIGSNDATLLKAYANKQLLLLGIDPVGDKFKSQYPPHVCLVSDFFSAAIVNAHFSGKRAKVVTSIAMFYDLESPLDFMRQVFQILDDEGIWIFEQSYLPAMLMMNSYDTICHEHLAYYTLRQIVWMTERSGFKIIDLEINDINGGSLSVAVAKRNSRFREKKDLIEIFLREEERKGLDELATYEQFWDRVCRHRDKLLSLIRAINAEGKRIAGYGASTKGNVILQFCGLTTKEILFITDVNADKWGCFTPGTLIPIVPEIKTDFPDYYLVLPWSFRANFLEREKAFLEREGGLIFPLPEIEVINKCKKRKSCFE